MARKIAFELNDAQRVINSLRGREYSDPRHRITTQYPLKVLLTPLLILLTAIRKTN